MVAILISAKLTTPTLLEIRVFWNKGYVVISVDDITDKILSRDSSFVVDVVMWVKFTNSVISVAEANLTSIL